MKRLLVALLSVAALSAVLAVPAGATSVPKSSPSGVAVMWTGQKMVVRHVKRLPVAHLADACVYHVTPGMAYVHSGGGPGGGATWEAQGKEQCPGIANYPIDLTTCMGQLLSNGWNNIGWSCQSSGWFTGGAAYEPSHWVGLTVGRWYCPYIVAQQSGQPTNAGFWTGWGVQG